MFRNTIAADSDAALVDHTIPEIFGALYICCVIREFGNARKAHDFRHLRIRMHVREVIVVCRHGVQKPFVRPAFSLFQVLVLFGERVGVGIDFGHAAMFRA